MARDRSNLATHFVDRHVQERRGNSTAILFEGRTLTYDAVRRLVNQAGNGLLALGVQPEDRVVVVLPDTLEFAAVYFGAVKIGAVAVPTNTALRRDGYAHVLHESKARVLVAHASLWSEIEPALDGRHCKVVVAGELQAGHLFWDDWIAAQAPDLDPAATSANDVAFWLWTSGSTGPPKAAIHRHGDWVHCCEHYARGVLGITETDVTFSSSKLFHAYGLGNALLFPFYVGATTALYSGRPQARAVLECAERFRPSLFFSVPTLYAAMLAETDRENPFRLDRRAGRRLRGSYHRRRRPRGRARPDRRPVGPRRERRAVLLEPAGAQPVAHARRLVLQRRQIHAGRRWLLLVCRTLRRYVSRLGSVGVADRGGGGVAGAPGGARIGGGGVQGRSRPREAESVRGAQAGPPAGSRPRGRVLQAFVKSRIAPYKYPRGVTFLPELPKTATGKILRFRLR